MSRVTCHMSRVTCNFFFFFFFFRQSGEASQGRVCYKRGLPRLVFKASALWADAFYKSICPYVCLFVCVCVCLFTFEVPFNGLFAPTSRSRMSNIFRDSESLGKSNGKKWSHIWTFLFGSGLKSPRKKKCFFLLILPYKTWWKPRFPMDKRPLVEGYIAKFGISLDVFEFFCFGLFFPFLK